jgi:hypothetical protein
MTLSQDFCPSLPRLQAGCAVGRFMAARQVPGYPQIQRRKKAMRPDKAQARQIAQVSGRLGGAGPGVISGSVLNNLIAIFGA